MRAYELDAEHRRRQIVKIVIPINSSVILTLHLLIIKIHITLVNCTRIASLIIENFPMLEIGIVNFKLSLSIPRKKPKVR